MSPTKIKHLAGLQPEDPWPGKLTFTITPEHYSLAELHQFETYLRSIGYINTASVRFSNGRVQWVFTRQKDAPEDPAELIRAAKAQLEKEAQSHNPGALLPETWRLIDRMNKWLEGR